MPSECLTWDAVCRRAGGRRKYNRVRQLRAELRLVKVVALLELTGFARGYQSRIARILKVSRGTISRDIARLRRRLWGGKEAEERHRVQERMQRRIRAEERLERDRMAIEAAAPDAADDSPASSELNVRPPTIDPAQAMFVPRWVSSPRSALADMFRPRRSRQARQVRGRLSIRA